MIIQMVEISEVNDGLTVSDLSIQKITLKMLLDIFTLRTYRIHFFGVVQMILLKYDSGGYLKSTDFDKLGACFSDDKLFCQLVTFFRNKPSIVIDLLKIKSFHGEKFILDQNSVLKLMNSFIHIGNKEILNILLKISARDINDDKGFFEKVLTIFEGMGEKYISDIIYIRLGLLYNYSGENEGMCTMKDKEYILNYISKRGFDELHITFKALFEYGDINLIEISEIQIDYENIDVFMVGLEYMLSDPDIYNAEILMNLIVDDRFLKMKVSASNYLDLISLINLVRHYYMDQKEVRKLLYKYILHVFKDLFISNPIIKENTYFLEYFFEFLIGIVDEFLNFEQFKYTRKFD